MRRALGELEIARTQGPRDAERLAREGVRAGASKIIVAGGDGTTSEVVSGLLAAELGDYAEVCVLPMGTGGDLVRTLELPRDIDGAIDALTRGKARRVDAGRVTYRNRTGQEQRAYYLNVASLGISGLTDELVNRAPMLFGGTVSFLVGTLRALVQYTNPRVRVRCDGEEIYDGPLLLATAANGRYFGGGMHVAPRAKIDDGLLDVVIVPAGSKWRVALNMPHVYRGRHLERPEVRFQHARVIDAETTDGDVWLDIDGEPLGTLPARFEVLPGAIALVGASS